MPVVTEDQILNALKVVRDPDLNRDIVSLGFVKNIKICDGNVAFDVELTDHHLYGAYRVKSGAWCRVSSSISDPVR